MNVIGHQAVSPHLHPGFAHLLRQKVEIDLLVAVLEEDRLAPIASLRHVVRQARNDDASEARHADSLAGRRGGGIGIVSTNWIPAPRSPTHSPYGTTDPNA